jgi:lipopolysaccharide/colanic/teichoic acid biosynthesis glycosyltransferase
MPTTGQLKGLKRLGEVLIALTVLLFTLPFLAFVGLVIKYESRGPIFEHEEHFDTDGRRFIFLRFRCTRIHTFHSSQPAITHTGRFLRYTGIDDLPQFINVLRGEVALIGYSLPERRHPS